MGGAPDAVSRAARAAVCQLSNAATITETIPPTGIISLAVMPMRHSGRA
jgi:hypothetical protein